MDDTRWNISAWSAFRSERWVREAAGELGRAGAVQGRLAQMGRRARPPVNARVPIHENWAMVLKTRSNRRQRWVC